MKVLALVLIADLALVLTCDDSSEEIQDVRFRYVRDVSHNQPKYDDQKGSKGHQDPKVQGQKFRYARHVDQNEDSNEHQVDSNILQNHDEDKVKVEHVHQNPDHRWNQHATIHNGRIQFRVHPKELMKGGGSTEENRILQESEKYDTVSHGSHPRHGSNEHETIGDGSSEHEEIGNGQNEQETIPSWSGEEESVPQTGSLEHKPKKHKTMHTNPTWI